MYRHIITKYIATLGISAMAFSSLAMFSSPVKVSAAGVSVSLTPSTANVSTTGNITLAYTSTVSVPTTGTISIGMPSGAYTGTPTFTIGAAAATFTSGTSGGVITYTLTPGAVVAVGSVSIVISGFTTPSAQQNAAFTVTTSTGDYGGAFQYVGSANVVQVRAFVPTSLSFSIRNSADTANTNTCDMGNLVTTTVGNCTYRLKIAQNATNGVNVFVTTSGNFTNGTASFTNAVAGTGGTGGTAITTGAENYGVLIAKGSITNGTTALTTAYNGGATNSVLFTNTTAASMLTYSGPNNPSASGDTTNTALVTHNAAISSNTRAGLYTQTVTYTVTPSF